MDPSHAADEPREPVRHRPPRAHQSRQTDCGDGAERLPLLLTIDEVATLLRTTRPAVYAMVARRTVGGSSNGYVATPSACAICAS